MERVNQYFKDRIEGFDDYYPCMQDECNLLHVYNWIQFFVSMYNDAITGSQEFRVKGSEYYLKFNRAVIFILEKFLL